MRSLALAFGLGYHSVCLTRGVSVPLLDSWRKRSACWARNESPRSASSEGSRVRIAQQRSDGRLTQCLMSTS